MLVRLCKNDQLRAETRKMHFGPGVHFGMDEQQRKQMSCQAPSKLTH